MVTVPQSIIAEAGTDRMEYFASKMIKQNDYSLSTKIG